MLFFGQKYFLLLLTKLVLFNPKMQNSNTKLNFKVPRKSCEDFELEIRKCKKCNLTDFDTSSVYRLIVATLSISYGFAAIDCQLEIM